MSALTSLLGEESSGALTCREQDFTRLTLLQRVTGEESKDGFLLPQDTSHSKSMSPATPFISEGNGVSSTPGTKPATGEYLPLNAELALSIVPQTDTDLPDFACGNNDISCGCNPCSTLAANGTIHSPTAMGVDNIQSHSPIPSEPFRSDSQQDIIHIANLESCSGLSREQHFLFSAPLHSLRHMVKRKQEMKGFSLPDSLARSFDASEMDKIAKTIVRVNKFGSSTATKRAHKSGSSSYSSFKHTTPRVLPSVGAFTVQCAKCFKWRLIPSKEKYEQIRQNILEMPFFCTSWRLGASCADPPELSADSKLLWAIDKPNIPRPPNDWQRLLVIRGEGCSKFADIYYVSPSGKKLRSMPEIERYLLENPELANGGVSLSQFSFASPRALDENYCRKRSTVMRGNISMIPTSNTWVRQPQDEQSFLSFSENASLAVEPLRAWDPDIML